MTLGFLGTGAIAAAMVTGFSSEGGPRHRILLSPRNADVAAGLASRFPNVSVAASNQEALDKSETVVLAIRPQVADEEVPDAIERLVRRPVEIRGGEIDDLNH